MSSGTGAREEPSYPSSTADLVEPDGSEDALQAAFRKRKNREPLNDDERAAERAYHRERNRRKLHVLLDTPEELHELKLLAKRHGYATAGEYVAEVLRGHLSEPPALRKEVERWRRRAEELEGENRVLRRRETILQRMVQVTDANKGDEVRSS